jgi:hypothetical protein
MLKDVIKLTRYVFSNFIPTDTPVDSKLQLYRLYRALLEVVERTNLVAEHYLVRDFSEPALQNSSYGAPSDKWRKVLNGDLVKLTDSVKNYLQLLNTIAPFHEDSFSTRSYLAEKYSSLSYYGTVRDSYSVGYLDAASFTLKIAQLDSKHSNNDSSHILKYKKIELHTLEQREALQTDLREKKAELQEQLLSLKAYIKRHVSLEDLL